MIRALIYPSSGTCDYSVELPHGSYCSWFDVCWSFGVVRLEWYPCCRLKHSPSRAVCLGKRTVAVKRPILEFPRSQGINSSDNQVGDFAVT